MPMVSPRHQRICERLLTVPALMSPTATRHAAGPSLAARRKRAGLLQRDVAARLGIRPSVVSSIETERAKHMAERDAYEAFLDGVERLNNAG